MKAQGMCADRSPDAISATFGKAGQEARCQTPRARPVKRGVCRRPAHPASADRAIRRPAEWSSAAGGMGVDLWSVVGGRGILLGANRAPAPVARRQAAVSANCATAHRRERFLRKSRAAANGQESKVRVREIRAQRANAGQRSAPLQPRRPNLLWRQSAVRLQAVRPRDRALLPPRGRDHNRPQPPAQRREEVARYREAAAGEKSSGSRPATGYRGAHSSVRRRGRPSFSRSCAAPDVLRPSLR
jgi:hypothetical protein